MHPEIFSISVVVHPELVVWPVWHDTKCDTIHADLIAALRLDLSCSRVHQIGLLD
jgi:hypothetical protein